MKKLALFIILFLSVLCVPNEISAQRTPTVGSSQVFQNGVAWGTSSDRLSDNKIIVSYRDLSGSSGNYYTIVGTVSGTSITWGTPKVILAGGGIYSHVVSLTSEKAVFVYEKETGSPDTLTYKVLTISGTTITAGPEANLALGHELSWQRSLRATKLSSDKIVVSYEQSVDLSDNLLKVVAGTVSGNTITWGTPQTVSTEVSNAAIKRVSDTKFALAYEYNDGVVNGEGMVVAGTVSGNTITMGTPQSFYSANYIGAIGLAVLSDSQLVIAFEVDGNTTTDPGKIFYATLSGTIFSFPGTKTDFFIDTKAIVDLDLRAISSTEVALVINGGSTHHGYYQTGILSGNNIALNSELNFLAGETDDPTIAVLNSDKFVISYIDDNAVGGIIDRGESKVFSLTATTNQEINIQGNATDIVSGDTSPDTGNHTDFGTGNGLTKTFTIQNTGLATLTLGANAVSVTGTNSSEFVVTTQPATSVVGGGTTTFTITFISAVVSTRSAVLHINNDDIHEYNYHFNIQGVGGAANTVPTVTTTTSSSITGTSVTLIGNLTDTGGTSCTGGIVYSITSINNDPIIGGTGVTNEGETLIVIGPFSLPITGLAAGTQYSFKAFSTNNEGTSYGAVQTFTTYSAPSVTTTAASSVTATSVTLAGNLTDDGGTSCTGGIVYSITSINNDPIIGGTGVTKEGEELVNMGAFSVPTTGLTAGTQYSFKAFSTNSEGTSYGGVQTFTTSAPTVTLALSGSPLAENGGVATVTATLSAASSQTVTVIIGATGTATGSDTDYTLSSTTITINAGATTGTATITGADDALDEDSETVIIDITGVTNGSESGTQQVTASITDDDAPPTVSLSLSGSPLAENAGVATITASLNTASGKTVTVTIDPTGTATDSGIDYTLSSTTITIAAGAMTGTATITGADDAIYEGIETVIIDITGVANGSESGTQQVTATVTDDESVPTVSLSISGSPLAENGGVATITATLSNASSQTTSVTISPSGTATGSGIDYTLSSTTIIISAGSTTGVATITGADDALDEDSETVIIDITGVVNATENGIQQITASITDDDAGPTVTLALSGSPLAENGGVATVTAFLNTASSKTVTVTIGATGTATGSGTDYTLSSTTITINAGSTSGTATITGADDALDEDSETVIIDITGVTNGSESGTQQVTASITDDDAPPTVSLSLSGSPLAENAGVGTITASLSAASGKNVVVTIDPTGTATDSGIDYTLSSTTITIAAGAMTGTATITGADDAIYEGIETVIIDITGVANGSESGTQQVTATVTDDESVPTVSLSISGSPFAENGGVATITATLSNASSQTTSVTISPSGTATGSGIDYTLSSTTIIISAGATTGVATITGADDALDEDSETVIIDITGVVNATENGIQQITASITDDDAGPTVTLGLSGSPLAENGGVATVTASLNTASSKTVTVTIGATGTATGSGTDYTLSSTTITINAGTTSGTATITGADDTLDEDSETVIIDITGVTNATESGTQQVTASITDDDDAPTVTLGLSGSPLAENAGVGTITASLNVASGKNVVVTIDPTGTATGSGVDYTLSSTTITIAAGAMTGTATVTGQDDAIYEGNETIIIDITGVTNGTESGTQQVTATITDNESAPTVSLSISGSPFAENGGVATITATLDNASSQTTTVTISPSGTATGSGIDYTLSSTTITISAGTTTGVATITGADDALYESNETVIIDITGVANATENGTQQVTATIIDDDLSTPSITFGNISKIYGDANFNLGAISNSAGIISFSIEGTNTTGTTLSGTNNSTVNLGAVGTITLRATIAANGIYSSGTKDITLTIHKATLTVTADNKSRDYGDANPAFTLSYSGFKNSETSAVLTTEPTGSSIADVTVNVGTVDIDVAGGLDDNYDFLYVKGTLTIGKATLTVTADNKSRVYGDANPVFTISYSGFRNSETSAVLTTEPTGSSIATTTTNTGTVDIDVAGGLDDNYDFLYVKGTLTIGKATLTVTADNKSKSYGAINPAFTISYSGFKNGDTSADLTTEPTGSSIATTTTNIGTVEIDVAGGLDDNYDFLYVKGTLTIGKATLTVTADDKTKSYGDTNPAFTISYSGFRNSETSAVLTIEPTASSIAMTTTNVGNVDLDVAGGLDDNYDFVYVKGTLTIGKATLTVTADDKAKTYGDANPAFTISYSGFKNGDTSADLTTEPTGSSIAMTTTNAGDVDIDVAGGLDDNYNFNYVKGTLTIDKATLTVTADNQTKDYGDSNPAFTISYSGFKNGDTSAVLTIEPTASSIATSTTNVGTVDIDVAGGSDDNYDFLYVKGTLTIGKTTLTVTADNKAKSYGDTNPAFTISYSGFKNSETSAVLTVEPTASSIATLTTNIGTVDIDVAGGLDDNYDFLYVKGTLTIGKATLTVTADDKSRDYAAANPAFTISYSGFKNSETSAVLTVEPTASSIATSTTNAGDVDIDVAGGLDDNYNFNYVKGILTIGKATLTVTADDQTKDYGDANPAFTISYSGFKNGDTSAVLTTEPTGSSIATTTTNVGSVDIDVAGGLDDNYDFLYVKGTLTIGKIAITVTADADQKKTSGSSDPVFTYQITSGNLTGGDSLSGALSREAGELAGPYTLQIGTLSAGTNYDLTFVSNDFIISVVITTGYINRSSKAVIIEGKVSSLVGVIERGVVYSETNMNPEIGGANVTKIVDSSLSGPFSVTITGLSSNTTYYFQTYIITNVAKSAVPTAFFGGVQNFTTLVSEPELVSKSPINATLNVDPTASLSLTFDMNIQAGVGNVFIKKVSDDALIESIDVTSSNFSISGQTVTITPSSKLPHNTEIYVTLPFGSVRDLSANSWTGLVNKTDWTFTTLNNAPTFTSTAITSVNVGDTYNYNITTDDIDGDKITITATTKPSWLSIASIVTVSTLAGSTSGFADGSGITAQFNFPRGVAIDSQGNVYVSDQNNHRIRKITPAGEVSTFAGAATAGSTDGIGTAAQFNFPSGVALDSAGNLYVADFYNHRIRKITPEGVVSTLAGSTAGFADGTGSSAQFSYPYDVAVDGSGNVYVADYNNRKIRKITPGGVVSTLAGSTQGSTDGTGTAAQFNNPISVAVDGSGNVYVADETNHNIRKITPGGIVSTLAGSTSGFADGIGAMAKFSSPTGVAVDGVGNVFVADSNNNKIRKITPEGVVSTFAGSTFGSADGSSDTAQFHIPVRVAVDRAGNVYVSDRNNHKIRKIETSYQLTGNSTGHTGLHNIVLKVDDGNGGSVNQGFTITVKGKPTVTSSAATAILANGATLNGNVTADNYGTIIERGFVYSLSTDNTDPNIGETNVTKVVATGTTGAYAKDISSLTAGLDYTFKAYATNSVGTSYGSVETFNTDNIPPTITITSDVVNPTNTAFTAVFTFSENVTNFDLSDITLTNATASIFTQVNTTTYTALIVPTTDGNVTVDVAAGSLQDLANNDNTVSNTFSILYDITPPTVAISSPVANPTNTTFTTTFTFSEDVTDFDVSDITLTNATASDFSATSAAVYTALITPTTDGTVTVDLAADVATDAATNGNTVATQLSTLYDATAPDMPIVIAIDSYTCAGITSTTADTTLVFNGTAEADSTVDIFVNNSFVGTTTANSAGAWSFDHTDETLADATYNITATATDAATNTSDMSAGFSIIVDTKDFDGDGNPDFCDDDDDNDGVLDVDDNSYLPNPDQLDTDGDGLADVEEDCDTDGIVNYYDTDVASCQDTIVMKDKYGFSPNGDGVNDTWVVEDIQLFPNNVVHVYNRSGKMVYTMKGYDNSFNGFSNKASSGKKLPVGAYYFTVEFNTPGAKPAKGWIYINY